MGGVVNCVCEDPSSNHRVGLKQTGVSELRQVVIGTMCCAIYQSCNSEHILIIEAVSERHFGAIVVQ